MARKRTNKENAGLPRGWRFKNGAYRYQVPVKYRHLWDNKSEFTLGKTLPEAYRVWADRLQDVDGIFLMGDLMDQYLIRHVPTKSYGAQESDKLAIRRLRKVFGNMKLVDVEPQHAYKYADIVTKSSGFTSAKHDIQTLRHMLTKAVEWGDLKRNPLLGQVRLTPPPGVGVRDRFVEDWEIREALSIESSARGVVIVQPYIRFKLMTGLRRIDILQLKLSDIRDDGVHVQPSKTRKSTGKRLIIEWDDRGELKALIDDIKRIPPRRIGDTYLFTTREGKCYVNDRGKSNAFDSIWQRFMDKVMTETKVSDRFQERDLRAKVASESDTLEEASDRLGHADPAITNRVYRRKPVRVKALIRD